MASPGDTRVVSLDFGTAFSKAATVVRPSDPAAPLRPEALAVGREAGWTNDYLVPSAIYLDAAQIRFGAQALAVRPPPGREVLQSFKLLLGASELVGLLDSRAPKKIDPDSAFSYRDLITLYLAYFFDLMEGSLGQLDLARPEGGVVMRYTRPGWFNEHIERDHREIVGLLQMGKAVLQRLGAGFWRTPLPYATAREAIASAPKAQRLVVEAGVFEATAAAACYIAEAGPGRCFIILDMGAGTTDLGAYLFPTSGPGQGQIIASRATLPVAGDDVDRALLNLLVEEAVEMRSAPARSLLWRSLVPDVRAYKQRLFETGELNLKQREGALVCTARQFTQSQEFRSIVNEISTAYRDLVEATATEASRHGLREIVGVATGGGAALPFIQQLVQTAKPKRRIAYRPSNASPAWVQNMRDGQAVGSIFNQLVVVVGAVVAPASLLIRGTTAAAASTPI